MAPTTKISEHDHTPLSLAPAMSDAERSARTDELLEASAGSADVAAEVVAEVVRLNLGIARSIAMRYRNRGVAEDDLVQVAYLGLVKAIQGFDPTKGGHFLAYAVPTIRGEIKRFFRDSAWVVRTSRRVQELQREVTLATSDYAQETGREPSAAELAARLETTVAKVDEARGADGCFTPTSLDAPTAVDEASCLGDSLGEAEPGYDRAEAVVALRPLCDTLDRHDRRLLYLRFFCQWTQAAIAAELGLTQMQVSRRLSRVLSHFRRELAGPPSSPPPARAA